jgi:hypothetical protein
VQLFVGLSRKLIFQQEEAMNRFACAVLVAGAVFFPSVGLANAASCTSEITQFEDAVRHSEKTGAFGPTAPQSIDAQLGHQPTARSVMQAEGQAQAKFNATLVRAKKFSAQGDNTECMHALSDAKLMFDAL